MYKYLSSFGTVRGIPKVPPICYVGACADHLGTVQHNADGLAGTKPGGLVCGIQ